MISEKRIYLFFFIIGTVVPLYFIHSFISVYGIDFFTYAKFLFANPASSTFSSDLLIVSFAFWAFMHFDRKTVTKTPHPIMFIILNLSVGLSAALPLYLYFRAKNINP